MIKKQQNNKISKLRCSKGFVNGPCGGFVNGKCEIDLIKDCVWVLVYEKLKKTGKFKNFVNQYIPPNSKRKK
jgi:hypothetical protein